jgi:uncharacterized protein
MDAMSKIVRAAACLAFSLLVAIDASAADQRLIQAVRDGNIEAVRSLLKQRVDVNAKQGDGATALHWAVFRDDPVTTDLLLAAGAQVNVVNDLGVPPLWLAARTGSSRIISRLLAAGANPNAIAVGEPMLMAAARSGNETSVKALLSRGADVNARDAGRGQTALMWAAAYGHPLVVKLLLDAGADVHARSTSYREVVQRANRYAGVISRERAVSQRGVIDLQQGGSTALLFAARQGQLQAAKLLIAAGAEVNAATSDGISPLVMASHSGHGQVAAYLLAAGADPNHAGAGYTALHAAVLRGDLNRVTELLKKGADPNARLRNGTASRRYSRDFAFNHAWVGATPFWLAARFGEPAIMRALVAGAADPTLVPEDGTTAAIATLAAATESGPSASDARERRLDPLDLAERAERRPELEQTAFETVTLALQLGIDPKAVNPAGDTALHHAAGKGFQRVVQLLVDRGAEINARNKRGQTPLAMARANRSDSPEDTRYEQVQELLRRLGAER